MKKDTKIIILLAVLLVCVAAYKLTGYYNDKQEETPTVDFVTINQDDIREITWNYGGIEYTINNETGVWHWTGDEDFPVDEDKANNLAQKFADITATREFSEDDLSEYGVEESEIKITATLSDGESYKFTIGNKNEVTNENYVMLDGNDNIYMVESSFASAFEKTIDDLLKMEDIPQVTDPNKIQIAMGDGTVKKFLNDLMQNELKPIRERREELAQDIGEIFAQLKKGSENAREVASQTLHDVKAAMGIDYFGKSSLF